MSQTSLGVNSQHSVAEWPIQGGVDPEFFLGGGAPLRNGVTHW